MMEEQSVLVFRRLETGAKGGTFGSMFDREADQESPGEPGC